MGDDVTQRDGELLSPAKNCNNNREDIARRKNN